MRRWRQWSRQRKTVVAGAALVVVVGAAVAAIGDPARDESGQFRHHSGTLAADGGVAGAGGAAVASTQSALSTDGAAVGETRAAGAAPAFTPPAPAPAPVPGGDNVVRRGSLDLEVRRGSFSNAFRAASEVASAHGGFVAGSNSSSHDERLSSGSLTLRVPGDKFDAARRALSALGSVRGEQLSGSDVGAQLVDLGARLGSARVQEDALRALMGRANTVGETLQVQEQLGRVRQEIEQLTAEQKRVQDAVAMATIDVRLAEPGVTTAPPSERSGLARSFERAGDGAVAVVGGTIVVLGYLLPLLVLALLGWIAVRLTTARRPRSAPSVSPG